MFGPFPSPAAASAPPFLGVGPMSKNAVDAAIGCAYRTGIPIMLIPSRRQVDSEEFGRGYVAGWSTQEFAAYVRSRDPDSLLSLCRDHGGPWQSPHEQAEQAERAGDRGDGEVLASSLASFAADIDAGFDLLHIDTSVEGDKSADAAAAIRRLIELYDECAHIAAARNRRVRFEIGFEEQDTLAADPEVFQGQLDEVIHELRARRLPHPTFVVGRTGTKVVEAGNAGDLTDHRLTGRTLRSVAGLTAVCRRYGTHLKAHNCDYLAPHLVRGLVGSGVTSINIAPELGVTETRGLLRAMDELGLAKEKERFLEAAHDSGKWEKWLAPGSTAADYERAVLAGHYVFHTPAVREITESVRKAVERRRGRNLDELLRAEIGLVIERYLYLGPTRPDIAAPFPPRTAPERLLGAGV